METSALLGKMTIFIILMAIGYICAKTKYTGQEFTRDVSKLVLNVFMAAAIINSVLGTDVSVTGRELLLVMLVTTIGTVVGYVVAAVGARLLPMDEDKRPLFELLAAVSNNMFIGMPVLSAIYGNVAVFYCSLSCIPFNVVIYSYGVYRLRSGGKGGVRFRDMLSVPMCATLVALLIFLFKLPVPYVVKDFFGTTSAAMMPLSMIVIGSSLGSVSLLDSFKDWRLYISSALRLVVSPLIVWLIVRQLTSDPVLLTSVVVLAASPSGIIVTMLAIQYGRDPVYTSKGVLLSTVLSMATIPAITWLLA